MIGRIKRKIVQELTLSGDGAPEVEGFNAEASDVIEIRAGGRGWTGTPEQFRDLRDKLNEIEIVEADEEEIDE